MIDVDEHLRLPRVLPSLSNRMFRYNLTVLYTNCIVATYYTMAAMPVCTKRNVAHIDRRGKAVRANFFFFGGLTRLSPDQLWIKRLISHVADFKASCERPHQIRSCVLLDRLALDASL